MAARSFYVQGKRHRILRAKLGHRSVEHCLLTGDQRDLDAQRH